MQQERRKNMKKWARWAGGRAVDSEQRAWSSDDGGGRDGRDGNRGGITRRPPDRLILMASLLDGSPTALLPITKRGTSYS